MPRGKNNVQIVENSTPYRTADLRRIFAEVLRDYHTRFVLPRRVSVKVVNGGGGAYWVGGYGWYDSERMVIRMPRLDKWVSRSDRTTIIQDIAETFQHELDHLRGLRHSEMRPDATRVLPSLAGFTLTWEKR